MPLSPLPFLRRAESLHRARTAVIYGDIRRSCAETAALIRVVAEGTWGLVVQKGDTVSVLRPSIKDCPVAASTRDKAIAVLAERVRNDTLTSDLWPFGCRFVGIGCLK